jgi:hypothetical protein
MAGITTRVVRMKLRDLKLLDLNARYMRHETFATLVANLRRDGMLTSVPFACLDDDGRYLVLSGNHRVKAAIEAGIEEADVLVTDDDLDRQRRVAIQLSHNALTGEDDPATLKALYDELEEIDWRDYAGLDDRTLGLLDSVSIGALSEANLSFQTVTLTFLPDELEDVAKAWEEARALLGSKPDVAWVARMSEYDAFLDGLETASKSYKISNVALTLLLMLKIFRRHREDLVAGFLDDNDAPIPEREKSWIPLEAVLGTSSIPVEAASTIRRAIKKMRDQDDVSEKAPWQALEFWAADYLAGSDG